MHIISSTYKASHAAIISIISNLLLISFKIVASIITGSVSILSEALHSLSDLLASIITWLSVRYSEQPADEKHPYGHKKIENVTASIEALLILLAAVYIFYESIERIIAPVPIEMPYLAVLVLFVSFIVNLIVSTYLYRVVKQTQSLALEGDALHLRADMFASLGMILGFLLIAWFQWFIVDSILAMIVAIYMAIEGIVLFKKAFNPLIDEAANMQDIELIQSYLISNQFLYHNLKTRKSGNFIFAEFHLELPPYYSLQQVHNICDKIEEDLKKNVPNLELIIHVEPKEKNQ